MRKFKRWWFVMFPHMSVVSRDDALAGRVVMVVEVVMVDDGDAGKRLWYLHIHTFLDGSALDRIEPGATPA
jgi:hypothetical protein